MGDRKVPQSHSVTRARSTRKKRGGIIASAPFSAHELSFQLERQRRQVLRAMGVVEVCRLASDSKLMPIDGGDELQLGDALVVAHQLLDGVAEQLETMGARSSAFAGEAP
jgi:hypothetical protein